MRPCSIERVGLRPEARPHEKFLNIAQAAELAVQQIFAVTGTEQAARDHDFSGAKLLLVELAATNLQDNMRRCGSDRCRGWRRSDVVNRQRKDRLILGKGYGNRIDLRTRNFDFFGSAGLRIFDCAIGVFGGAGADRGLVPIISHVRFRLRGHFVLNIDFGGSVRVGTAVGFGIDQRKRYFGHARRLAVARAGKDDVFHARTAQGLGRLLAQHPRDRIGDVRLAAAVRADNGRHAVSVELELGAVAERLEPENLKPLQFEQRELLETCGQLSVASCQSVGPLLRRRRTASACRVY